MLHTIAFSSSVSATTSALTNLAGVADPTVRVSGNFIYMPALAQVGSIYAIGAGIVTGELQSPTMRRIVNFDVSPLDTGSTPTTPLPFNQKGFATIKLDKDEALSALATTNVPGSARQNSVLVHLHDAPITPVTGEIFTVAFTLTAASGNYTWNNAAITLGQTLPVGTYQCVGGRLEGTGLIGWRFYPVGEAFRPGFIGSPSSVTPDPEGQRYGKRGVLFEFNELTPPTVDTFGSSVSGTLQGYMDIIKK